MTKENDPCQEQWKWEEIGETRESIFSPEPISIFAVHEKFHF